MRVEYVDEIPGGRAPVAPFEEFSRDQWANFATRTPLPLTETDIERIASLGDPIDLAEVDAIYRPLSALLQLYIDGKRRLGMQQRSLLQGSAAPPTPFIIGVGGSVAVGKSTVSRLLALLLSRWPRTPRVELVTTDGFLYPNRYLQEHGLMQRKGFPESYDRAALLKFVAEIKSGVEEVTAPVYSHVTYDIVPDRQIVVNRPDILILEGLNVFQPAKVSSGTPGVGVADYFDFRIFVDADNEDIERWYVNRFLQLRETAFTDPDSYFHTYADLSDHQARKTAKNIWRTINLPNLVENIAPTKSRATLVLQKDETHRVARTFLRKI